MVDVDVLNDPLVHDLRLLRPDIKAAFAVMSARIRRAQAERLTAGRTEWPAWLRECFPGFFSAEFATHHQMFWEHIWSIKPDVRPKPFLAVWPRGGGKSSSAEVSTIMLGVHGERHYALYVSGTQDQADKHVESIAGLLESSAFAARYPTFANRRLGKYGHSRGWRRNRLHTEPGFMIDAAGLDRAVRGIKAEQVRPDVIIFDDLDDLLDSPATVAKKIKVLTRSILPAGSNDVAIIGVQNLIHEGSIFTMLATHQTDFLLDHLMSGPIPAVTDLEYILDEGMYRIIAGEPTWAGQNLAQCQALLEAIGLTSFLIECQHDVEDTRGGIYEHIEFQHCDWNEVPTLERIVVWVDPAVTNTDDSDSHGIQADGYGKGKLYRLFSWEGRTSPEDALKRAVLKAVELKASHVGVETDQGGDTWKTVYDSVIRDLQMHGDLHGIQGGPGFKSAKAGAGHGPKAHRQAQMLAAYERGEIIHVRGTHTALERALKRFGVRKPYDLADSAYWAWYDLCGRRRWLPVGS
jgi:phage terminase large subunit-like protein